MTPCRCPVSRDRWGMYSGTGHHCQQVRDMTATLTLLDKYKVASSITSDNACAVSLGVSRQAVSKWRNGENHPDADIIEAMCEATGESLAHWLPLIEADRARSPAVRKVWLRLAQAAAAIATAFLMLRHGIDTHAVSAFVFVPAIHYAK